MATTDLDFLRVDGNTADPLIINCKQRDENGDLAALDLTGLTVTLYSWKRGTSSYLTNWNAVDVTADIATPTNGIISHTLTANEAADWSDAGNGTDYHLKIKTDDGAGAIRWLPSDHQGTTTKTYLVVHVVGNFS